MVDPADQLRDALVHLRRGARDQLADCHHLLLPTPLHAGLRGDGREGLDVSDPVTGREREHKLRRAVGDRAVHLAQGIPGATPELLPLVLRVRGGRGPSARHVVRPLTDDRVGPQGHVHGRGAAVEPERKQAQALPVRGRPAGSGVGQRGQDHVGGVQLHTSVVIFQLLDQGHRNEAPPCPAMDHADQLRYVSVLPVHVGLYHELTDLHDFFPATHVRGSANHNLGGDGCNCDDVVRSLPGREGKHVCRGAIGNGAVHQL
mmetsp:Transcript_90766/g.257122  ORF Transcript_90766/g.257122 Transcript_90766/m.257122 type:complete len:260 (-) Transcript_90766:428-1207(-)